MATNTEHYNLVKPDYDDAADVAQLNGNMDIIDSILWQLANAGADEELLKKVQEILDKIGETDDTGGSTTLGSVFAKLNNIISGNETNETKIDTVIKLLGSGVQEWKEPGTYQFKVPEIITKIKVTACGAGGGGATGGIDSGGGGGGGDAIIDKEFEVTPGEIIEIVIGKGGLGATYDSMADISTRNGKDGQATVIGRLITLPGGKGGLNGYAAGNTGKTRNGVGGEPGGVGGGRGGDGFYTEDNSVPNQASQNGQDGILGKGGLGTTPHTTNKLEKRGAGGAGGGSLGNGTNGKNATQFNIKNKATRGAGGAGAAYGYYQSQNKYGQGDDGGDGYAKFVWGY